MNRSHSLTRRTEWISGGAESLPKVSITISFASNKPVSHLDISPRTAARSTKVELKKTFGVFISYRECGLDFIIRSLLITVAANGWRISEVYGAKWSKFGSSEPKVSEPDTRLLYDRARKAEARKPKVSAESWAKSPFRWALGISIHISVSPPM
jgi:hypothetical protein